MSAKYLPDWRQTPGKVTKREDGTRVFHPHDLISLVHRKKGLDAACALAHRLIVGKYQSMLEKAKVPV